MEADRGWCAVKLEVRIATADDLAFIDHLQKRNAEELAFYPKGVFEREIESQRIVLALVNNQHAGYLYHGATQGDQVCKIHQACIEYDLRGQWYGAGLVASLEDTLNIVGAYGISLRCGSDIAANSFWRRMGFECVNVTPGGVRRMRDINAWVKELKPSLFPLQSVKPSSKAKDASFWRKRGKNSQSSMLRGKALIDYRNRVLKESDHGDPK
jgi:GNAT superfamily N-acetyltransferase